MHRFEHGPAHLYQACMCVCVEKTKEESHGERWRDLHGVSRFGILFESANTLGRIASYIVPCDRAEETQTEAKTYSSRGTILCSELK